MPGNSYCVCNDNVWTNTHSNLLYYQRFVFKFKWLVKLGWNSMVSCTGLRIQNKLQHFSIYNVFNKKKIYFLAVKLQLDTISGTHSVFYEHFLHFLVFPTCTKLQNRLGHLLFFVQKFESVFLKSPSPDSMLFILLIVLVWKQTLNNTDSGGRGFAIKSFSN